MSRRSTTSPAAAAPTSTFSGATVSDSGGRPWRPACASTLCRNSAIALMSSSGSAKGGIGGAPAGGFRRPPLTTGAMSSPALSLSTSCDRSRFGPPSWPPRKSTPWHAAQLLSVQPFPARQHASVGKRPLLLWEIRATSTTSGAGPALASSTAGGRRRILSHGVGRAHSDTQCDRTDQQ